MSDGWAWLKGEGAWLLEADWPRLKAEFLPGVAVVLRHEVGDWQSLQLASFDLKHREPVLSPVPTSVVDYLLNVEFMCVKDVIVVSPELEGVFMAARTLVEPGH